MASLSGAGKFSAPFANYDIVVYFGGGLFFTAIAIKIAPGYFGRMFSIFSIGDPSTTISQAVQIIGLLFTAYLAGHIVAFVSDIFVEKTLVSVFGYPLHWADQLEPVFQKKSSWQTVREGCNEALKRAKFVTLVRLAFTLPVTITFVFLAHLSWLDFYRSRIPPAIIDQVLKRSERLHLLGSDKKICFRSIEQYSIQNYPDCIPRLYNYVVIYGLLRTLSFSMICVFWYVVLLVCRDPSKAALVRCCLVYLTTIFAVMSFAKFYRRYTEEAIFAFCFGRQPQTKSDLESPMPGTSV